MFPSVWNVTAGEPWLPDQDITRTIGWFTALYPLVLRVQPGQSVLDLLRHTKVALQQIPAKGFPYGLLKYMSSVPAEERAKLEAKTPARMDVQFNYFGRFGHTGHGQSEDLVTIEWSDLFGLHDFAPNDHVIFDINPMPTLVGDCLRLIMEFNPRVYHSDVISQMMTGWRHNLVQLANTAKQSSPSMTIEPIVTQYDFPQLALTDTEFKVIVKELNIRHIPLTQLDDLLPCIAVQGGLLASLSKDPSSYLIQMAVTISGPLDSGRLIFAWNRVANQHAPLRTVFMESSAKQSQGFVQAVLRSSLASWTITDIPLDSLNDFFITNRRRGFNLHDQMIRNFVFPTADGLAHQVIVTIHHSLIDGWSLPLLLQQWKLAYHHPAMLVPAPLTGFSAVVDHVHKLDPIPAKAFWADYLLDAPVTPAPLLSPNY
ncbi:hypothetical protein H4R33_007085, partial [Dimargaris cristalligena]